MTGFWAAYRRKLAESPDAPALADLERSMTRRELDDAAEAYAAELRAKGVGPGKFNVIVAKRDARMWVKVLGTLKAGAAFVACDDTMPAERLEAIRCDIATVQPSTSGLHPCFAVYTSGTTGAPKRIVHSERTLDLICHSVLCQGRETWQDGDVSALCAASSTIAAVIMFTSSLCYGSAMFVMPPEVMKTPETLVEALHRHCVSIVFLPPSFARLVKKWNPELRTLLLGSEPRGGIEPEVPEVYDFYASSESGFIMAVNGVPFEEGKVRVEAGEIVFGDEPVRMHDAAEVNPDGTIRITGRLDDMVKIGGNRVEPAEIEGAVRGIDGIGAVCACGFRDRESGYVILFYSASRDIAAEEFEQAILRKLPPYMMPLAAVRLAEFPRLGIGKIDKRSLPSQEMVSLVYLTRGGDSIVRVEAAIRVTRILSSGRLVAADEAARKEALPLTVNQRLVLESEDMNPAALAWNAFWRFGYAKARWSPNVVRRACEEAISAHPAFRMVLVRRNGEVRQKYCRDLKLPAAGETARPFDLFDSPLTRVSFSETETETIMTVDCHHVVGDGYSVMLLARDVERILEGDAPSRDFYCYNVKRIAEWQASPEFERQMERCRAEAAGEWTRTPPFEATGVEGDMTEEFSVDLAAEAGNDEEYVCRLLWALRRISGKDRVAIAYVNSARIDAELIGSFGNFLTNIPVRYDFSVDDGAGLEASVRRQILITPERAWCPFAALESDDWSGTGHDADYLEFYDQRLMRSKTKGVSIEELGADMAADTACELYLWSTGDRFRLTAAYDSSLYSAATMHRLIEEFRGRTFSNSHSDSETSA